MQIFIRALDGRTVTADVEPDFTVLDVKELLCYGQCLRPEGWVCERMCTPPPFTRITFGGVSLEDHRTLADCRVDAESTLHVCVRLSSGQVFVRKDWDRIGDSPRFVPVAWACSRGNGLALRHWVADMTGIRAGEIELSLEDGTPILDGFGKWAALRSNEEQLSITIEARRTLAPVFTSGMSGMHHSLSEHALARLPLFVEALKGELSHHVRRGVKDGPAFSTVACMI